MAHAPDVSTNAVKQDYSIVVFVNIDWKKSRHDNKKVADKNLDLLKGTVRSIIKIHEPVVICFCEVGETSQPMTSSQMSALSEVIEATWKELLQSTKLQSSFTQGYPYLTVWDSSRVDCFNFHITKGLYQHQPISAVANRTAFRNAGKYAGGRYRQRTSLLWQRKADRRGS